MHVPLDREKNYSKHLRKSSYFILQLYDREEHDLTMIFYH